MNGKYEIGDYVLTNWKLVKELGAGAFGKVYEAHRDEFGMVYKAAIKIITIPQTESEILNAQAEGMTNDEVSVYFQDMVQLIVTECAFMAKVKGVTNIVGYEDHDVIPHSGKIGWDIIIRMELLTPLLKHVKDHPMSAADTAKLGIDICRALEVCNKMNIIHRDIKPENVMISEFGSYKLGDFGISRTLEATQGGLSKKGTMNYMAPEVAKGEPYGSTVDIYSLGIMMYRFLNHNRMPFMPDPPEPITFKAREEAQEKRMKGEPLPFPKQADEDLGRIVLRACAYLAKDRYASPRTLRMDLETWLKNAGIESDSEPSTEDSVFSHAQGLTMTEASVEEDTQASEPTEPCVSFDKATGTLTLRGNVVKEEVRWYENTYAVITVRTEKGTVFPEDCSEMFKGFKAKTIDLSNADTSNVTDMSSMFDSCSGLSELDVSGFDTSNVTDMACMFHYCRSLSELDVSGFDTSNVESMWYMFNWCSSLSELDVSGFDTSNVTDMANMFCNCSGLSKLDVSGFDTSNVKDMTCMFHYCRSLSELDVSGFDTSNVANMSWMFHECSGLSKLDVSRFDTSNVKNMSYMFHECSGLSKLDVSGFDTSNITDMVGMFYGCSGLRTILVSDSWRANADMNGFFFNCKSLVGGNGTKYDGQHFDGEYARVDKPGQPGYFTYAEKKSK